MLTGICMAKMDYFVLLSLISIVGCGTSTGIKQSLQFNSNNERNVLKDGEKLLLNCTGTLSMGYALPVNKSFYYQLFINDYQNRMINKSAMVYSNGIQFDIVQWICIDVQHEFHLSTKQYSCIWKTNFTGSKLKESSTIVFSNPPETPDNITYMFLHQKLYIFADSPYSKLVRNRLDTTYSLRFRGSQCTEPRNEIWQAIDSCKVKDNRNEYLALCMVDLKKYGICSSYDVAIVVIHDGDKGQTKAFHIKTENEKEASLNVFAVYKKATQIAIALQNNIEITRFHDVQYRVKYKKVNEENYKEIASFGDTINIRNLTPNQCYLISAKMVAAIYSTDDVITTTWTIPSRYCTTTKVLIAPPVNFTCSGVVKIHEEEHEPTAIKLSWHNPSINEEIYGAIKSFHLVVHTRNAIRLDRYFNHTVASENTSYHEYYSQGLSYKLGSTVWFRLSACNSVSCSVNTAHCRVIFKDTPVIEEIDFNLSIFLSCIVPTVLILVLVASAFWSYYSKRQILDDLETPLTCTGKTNLGVLGVRNSSIHEDRTSTTDSPHVGRVQSTPHPKNKFVDQQITAQDDKKLSQLFASALQNGPS